MRVFLRRSYLNQMHILTISFFMDFQFNWLKLSQNGRILEYDASVVLNQTSLKYCKMFLLSGTEVVGFHSAILPAQTLAILANN